MLSRRAFEDTPNVSIGALFPLTVTSSARSSTVTCGANAEERRELARMRCASRVAASHSTPRCSFFACPISRAAILTQSPMTVNSQREREPRFPQNARPLHTPAATPSAASGYTETMLLCISTAATSAREASSTVARGGAPNTAISTVPLSSTRNCRSVPPHELMIPTHLRNAASSCDFCSKPLAAHCGKQMKTHET